MRPASASKERPRSKTPAAGDDGKQVKEKMSMDDAARFIQRKWNRDMFDTFTGCHSSPKGDCSVGPS